MRALTGELLLTAWDRGARQHSVHQGLVMLALAMPEYSFEQIAEFSLGENNLRLLQVHAMSFGPAIEAFATCSQCGAHMEAQIPVAELIDRQAASPSVPEEWSENGRLYRLRPLTCSDLLSSLDAATSAEAEQAILERCTAVLPQPDDSSPLPSTESLMERFERVNQAAEISCDVQCPACSTRASRHLNLAQFLFRLVDRGAKRLLREIHELAWAYGWSEEAILRMSAGRRGAYLEMLNA
jgi:hypothetical protein